MIIIKTKTGDIFVNDKEMVNVTHNRELHTADIHDGKGMGTLWRKPPIEHVESVNYINEQTAKEWKDNGSELEYLHKEMDSLKMELQCQTEITKRTKERLRQLGHECVQWVQYYHEHMTKELCEQMRNRGEEVNALGVPEGYNAFCTRGVSGWLETTERHWRMAQRISGLEKPNMLVYGGGDDVAEWCKAHDVVHVKEYINKNRE